MACTSFAINYIIVHRKEKKGSEDLDLCLTSCIISSHFFGFHALKYCASADDSFQVERNAL